ncbi:MULTISPECIES: hypothetical protein [Streptomyces]|uniref:hypothetical protein n=1 Tax=Streptomyces TaxID=1883 RepID=UPI001F3CF4A6|nr:hypothetical protein [Streptomyces sp. A1-5]UJB39634.1 hypothetical protein HRD51_00820 [Streptomyces sp. A1-5]
MTDQHSSAVAFAELHRLADHFFQGRADLDDAAHRPQAGSQAGHAESNVLPSGS